MKLLRLSQLGNRGYPLFHSDKAKPSPTPCSKEAEFGGGGGGGGVKRGSAHTPAGAAWPFTTADLTWGSSVPPATRWPFVVLPPTAQLRG